MPGGRLTQQERQQIALGLADGLAYAQIARGLGRPTSTVTREVMRNGGPTAYRADLAHRATERRTRRRGPTAPPEAARVAAASHAELAPAAEAPDTDAVVAAVVSSANSASASSAPPLAPASQEEW